MKNFDIFYGIDWSGAKSPVKNKAIAMAYAPHGLEAPVLIPGPHSRSDIGAFILSLAGQGKRCLVGIDCNFGYAEKVAQSQFGSHYTAKDLWRAVDTACKSVPNYFAGPYWGLPECQDIFWVQGKKPADLTLHKRLTEAVCGESGYGWPESPFKLIGAKQVGKGGLAGMRLALALKRIAGDSICIWPFEPDLVDRAAVVITEIYPRQFLKRAGMGHTKIRKAEDMNKALVSLGSKPLACHALSDHDADALVSAAGLRYLCGDHKKIPETLANPYPASRLRIMREGWIFGAGH